MNQLYTICLVLLFTWPAVSCADEGSLKDAFAEDFLIGCAVNNDQMLNKNPKETKLIVEQFNAITPGNILKWNTIHPRPQQYNFAPGERFVEFGQKHNMFVVGHTLVWHNQIPEWVFKDANDNPVSKETLLARMKEHIFTVVGRYKGRIKGWDVVNEAIDDDGALRKNNWFKIAGSDYIIKAFEYAHEADPQAELYYNDYGMCNKERRNGAVRLIKELQGRGLRVDGIGMQGHWSLDRPSLDKAEDSIIAFSLLGIKVMITELDITVLPRPGNYTGADITQNAELKKELNPYPDGLPTEMQEKLAKRYAEIFKLFHKYAGKIYRVTFWGVNDGDSWLNHWPVKGRTDYPLLFDRDCNTKPAFDAVIKVVE